MVSKELLKGLRALLAERDRTAEMLRTAPRGTSVYVHAADLADLADREWRRAWLGLTDAQRDEVLGR